MVGKVTPQPVREKNLAHPSFAVVWAEEEAETPVGAAGGVQVPPTGVTERQMEGAEAAASLPAGCATTW